MIPSPRRTAVRLLALSLSIAALTACGSDDEVAALQKIQGDKFTVSLPGAAERNEQQATTDAGPVEVITYGSEQPDSYYSLTYLDYPAGSTVDLDGSVDGTASAMQGAVQTRTNSTINGVESRDATLTGVKNNDIEGTAFLSTVGVGTRLYRLLTVVKGANAAKPAQHDQVRDSLTFQG